jgi:molybdopterin synthase catalytic subunit
MHFRFTEAAIDTDYARSEVLDLGAGGYVSFEGWVRNYNEGQEVTGLEYEAFEELAIKEGERIVADALQRFTLKHALCIHRLGPLALSDMAVWVGVSSAHRGEAFDACRFIIDEVKHRVPIWKKEHYRSGNSGWVNCERCAAPPGHTDATHHTHAPNHTHAAGREPAHHEPATLKLRK